MGQPANYCLAAQVQQLEDHVDRQGEVARVGLSMEEFCRRVREGLDQATWEPKRHLIAWLVVRVIVTDGEVEIRYAIPTSPAGEGTRFCQLRADYRAALPHRQGADAHTADLPFIRCRHPGPRVLLLPGPDPAQGAG